MSRRAAAWLAWGLWSVTFAVLVLEVPPVNVSDSPLAVNLLGSLVQLAYATAGALIASRQPHNAIGWLLSGSALLSALGDLAIEYAVYGLLTRPGSLPSAALLGVFGGAARSLGFFLILTFLLLLFPTGRLPSPRWRPLAWVTLLAITLFCLVDLLGGDLSNADTRLTPFANPIGVIPAALADNVLMGLTFLLVFACIIGCCASVVVRFRRAQGSERQQLKWLAYAALWAGALYSGAIIGIFTNNPFLASSLTFELCLAGIPVAVGIAILRHGLFDIDILINRTLVYGSLTAVLAAVYFACVIGAQAITTALTGQTNTPPVIIVASTLLIAALFNPLRRRVQSLIDHRFYRRKYDAARTLAAFASTLRSEVELSALQTHLTDVVEQTMQPAHVSLWMPVSAGTRQPAASRMVYGDRTDIGGGR